MDTSKYTDPGYTPRNCCAVMDMALDEHYLDPTITLSSVTYPPNLRGETLTRTGQKRKPMLIIQYCPFCGKDLKNAVSP